MKADYQPDVAAIRKRWGMSQATFADAIRVPVGTIRGWEQGRRKPVGPARVLLFLIDKDPDLVVRTLGIRTYAVPE